MSESKIQIELNAKPTTKEILNNLKSFNNEIEILKIKTTVKILYFLNGIMFFAVLFLAIGGK